MSKEAKKIINEQIDNFVDKLLAKEAREVLIELLKENNPILDSLTKSDSLYNLENQITVENWDWFKQVLQKATQHQRFQYKAQEINAKLYCVKYFSKIKFIIGDTVEDEIKIDLKRYFTNFLTLS